MSIIDITFRQLPPSDELVSSIRRTCHLVGDAVCDAARWAIVVERESDGRPASRVELRLDNGGEHIRAEAAHDDPVVAVQCAFATLLQRLATDRPRQAA